MKTDSLSCLFEPDSSPKSLCEILCEKMVHFIPLPKLPSAKETAEVMFFFFFKYFFGLFSGFIDSGDEEFDRKQGKRQGVTRSKGTQAGSRTRVRRRASAHGSCALPTELCGAPTAEVMLRHVFRLHRFPKDVVSDQGLQFASISGKPFAPSWALRSASHWGFIPNPMARPRI